MLYEVQVVTSTIERESCATKLMTDQVSQREASSTRHSGVDENMKQVESTGAPAFTILAPVELTRSCNPEAYRRYEMETTLREVPGKRYLILLGPATCRFISSSHLPTRATY